MTTGRSARARPPAGIWGGLWTLPQFDDQRDRGRQGGWTAASSDTASAVRSFLHAFDLTLHPLLVRAAACTAVADSDRYCWYEPRQPAKIGLAKPAVELIRALDAQPSTPCGVKALYYERHSLPPLRPATGRRIGWVLLLLGGIFAAGNAVMFMLVEGHGSPNQSRFFATAIAGWSHAFGGAIAALIGPFQLITHIRTSWPRCTRGWGGHLLAVLAGGLAGLYFAPSARRARSDVGFAALAVFWLYSGTRAYLAIRRGNVQASPLDAAQLALTLARRRCASSCPAADHVGGELSRQRTRWSRGSRGCRTGSLVEAWLRRGQGSGAMTKDEILAYVPPAGKLLGREVVEVDQVNGGAVLRFRALPEFLNRQARCRAGLLCAMLDSSTRWRCTQCCRRIDCADCEPQRVVPEAGEARDLHGDQQARNARRAQRRDCRRAARCGRRAGRDRDGALAHRAAQGLNEAMARTVKCVLLGVEAEGLDYAPYPGELGQRIYENVSKEAWQRWLKHQTMLLNEYRLTPIEPKARKFLVEEMEKFFFGGGSQRRSRVEGEEIGADRSAA